MNLYDACENWGPQQHEYSKHSRLGQETV